MDIDIYSNLCRIYALQHSPAAPWRTHLKDRPTSVPGTAAWRRSQTPQAQAQAEALGDPTRWGDSPCRTGPSAAHRVQAPGLSFEVG